MSSHYKIKKSVARGYYWFVTKNGIIYRCSFTIPRTSNSLLSLDLKNPNAVLFYICDNTDSRAAIRQNRFRKWFEAHNQAPKKILIAGNVFGMVHAGAIMLENNTERSIIKTYLEEQLQQLNDAEKTGTIDELT